MATLEWSFVALGSNLGDRREYLSYARERIAEIPLTTLHAVSTIEETEPIGEVPQEPYLNQMVLVRTELTPLELLKYCQAIENEAGRTREKRWGPRTLDIDIVRYGDKAVSEDNLTIPHPELPKRAFWQREIEELETHVL